MPVVRKITSRAATASAPNRRRGEPNQCVQVRALGCNPVIAWGRDTRANLKSACPKPPRQVAAHLARCATVIAPCRRLPRPAPDRRPEVRDAGTEAMANPPKKWNETDETSDESFPASDPPGKH